MLLKKQKKISVNEWSNNPSKKAQMEYSKMMILQLYLTPGGVLCCAG